MVTSRGLNYADNAQDGDLASCTNLSGRRWPYLATRNRRAQQDESVYTGVSALTSWNGLVAVKGTDLLYRGIAVGQVEAVTPPLLFLLATVALAGDSYNPFIYFQF